MVVFKLTLTLAFVPRTGIEPALPCDNQILSLARLPVPPSGPGCKYIEKQVFVKTTCFFINSFFPPLKAFVNTFADSSNALLAASLPG